MPYGFSCHHVDTAGDAVTELKARAWPVVVVSAVLPDMNGPAFIDGLLRHFDPSTVVLLGEVEAHIAQLLSQSPKVRVFADAVAGVLVADHVFKHVSGGSTSSSPPTPAAPPTLAHLFDAPSRSNTPPAAATQGTPAQAFAMPPPTNTVGHWPSGAALPQAPTRPNTTMPFFAAFGTQPATRTPTPSPPLSSPSMLSSSMSSPSMSSSSPMMNGAADRALHGQIESLANELARSQADVVTLRARLQAAEQGRTEAAQKTIEHEGQRQRLDGELQLARSELLALKAAAQTDVAEIEAISDADHGAALEELRLLTHALTVERDTAIGQLELERHRFEQALQQSGQAARDRGLELDNSRRQLLEAHADVEQYRSAAEIAEQALTALEHQANAAADEVGSLRVELELLRERAIAHEAEREQLVAELAAAAHNAGTTAALQAELELLGLEKADVAAAWSAAQQRVAALELQLAQSEAGHLDVTLRSGERIAELEAVAAAVDELNERLNEAEHALTVATARADRAIADASNLRTFIEAQAHEQARVVGELEHLRPLAAEVDRARATLVDMQRQLEAALGTDDNDGSTTDAIDESVRARTRELLELARAIEPFTWGLQQATSFFSEANVDGATRHLQAMTLLQKTLERLKNELDRLHGSF